MKLPRTFDAVDLMYAIGAMCEHKPLHKYGLNRKGYRSAKAARKWFWKEVIKAINVRKRKVLKNERLRRRTKTRP